MEKELTIKVEEIFKTNFIKMTEEDEKFKTILLELIEERRKFKEMTKQYPNDMDLGKVIRSHFR